MAEAVYRFGAYELDLPRLELRRDGRPIALQPKALNLLTHLLRHRDRVVTKDELLTALWPDVVVTEASLSKAVSAARRALGDAGSEQTTIATVRGLGFRFTAPVEEVVGAGSRSPREPPPERRPEGAFVGRQELLGAIDDALAAASRGDGRMLLLAGEAGMGKTRAIQEAAALGADAGFRVLTGWCHEAEGAPDLWPWRLALRPLLEGPGGSALARDLGEGASELAELLPALRPYLPPPTPEQAPLDATGSRFRRLETLAEILERAAQTEPHLVLLDDFHRADPDSLSLLRFAIRALEGARLVLIVTHRVAELPIGHPLLDLARAPRCEARPLAGLTRAHVAELVHAEVGKTASESVAEGIRLRTDGNPFFVKELARALDAAGRLDAPESLEGPLPAGIRNVLHERLDRLSEGCRKLLILAALLGRDLDVALLAHAADCSAEEALRLLDEASAEHVVRDMGGSLNFSHALLREELLAPIPGVERARLHRTIGEALEAHYRDDLEPHLGRLAHHFGMGAAAGCADRAVDYGGQAGDRAVALHAHREAADHYRRALNALPLLSAPDEAARCELQLALGEALMATGEPGEGRSALERAAEAARRIGSPDHFARAALAAGGLEISSQVGVDDPALVALLEEALAGLAGAGDGGSELEVRLHARLGEALYWSDWERSVQVIERAVADGRALGDPVALAYALYGKHWLEFVGPGAGARLDAADEILELARSAGHRELALAGHSCRFLVLLQLGRSQDAKVELARYEELARQLRVPRYRWRGHCYQAALAALEGRLGDIESAAQRTLAEEELFLPGDAVGVMLLFFLHREQDRPQEIDAADLTARLPAFSTTWRAGIAVLLADAGRAEEARGVLDALVSRDFLAVPRSFTRLAELVLCAEACATVGDAAIAAKLFEQLLPYRPRVVVIGGGFYCLGSVDLFLGRLAAAAGDRKAARFHLDGALEANAVSGARPWQAWAQFERAALLSADPAAEPSVLDRLLSKARETAAELGLRRLERCIDDLTSRQGA